MKYTPTDFDSSHNISSRRPIREFLQYILAVSSILVIFYFVLGFLIDKSVQHITPQREEWIWNKMQANSLVPTGITNPKYLRIQNYVQELVDRIPQEIFTHPVKPKIRIMEEQMINAFAFPGGTIVITSGLIDKLKSENALMFILGHEIGHFMARDQIRQLGRMLVVLSLSILAFGEDSSTSNFIAGIFTPIRNKFSQHQETAADEWGIKVVQKIYGTAAGASEFFEIILKERSENRLLDSFATHPLSRDRIAHIEELKKDYELKDGELTVFPNF